MRYILAKANRDVLRRFARSGVLLAFDYDGTLAPIVADPDRARMRQSTRVLLRELAARRPCVVISGRARGDALRRLRGLGVMEVIGNHGIEPWHSAGRGPAQVGRWRLALAPRLARVQGVSLEDKAYSLAIHYRLSREKRKARAAIERTVDLLGDARVVRGKLVVNLVPSGAPHKGTALERARARYGCDTAIYVGDDETDEDVFALHGPDRLLAIRVGHSRASQAPYFVRNQREIDRLLRALLRELQPPARARRRAASPA